MNLVMKLKIQPVVYRLDILKKEMVILQLANIMFYCQMEENK